MTVWVAQCLCANRHSILAFGFEDPETPHGETDQVFTPQAGALALKQEVERLMAEGIFNPWCGICRDTNFHVELGKTRWATMEEATPHLKANEAMNLLAMEKLSVMHGSFKGDWSRIVWDNESREAGDPRCVCCYCSAPIPKGVACMRLVDVGRSAEARFCAVCEAACYEPKKP